MNDYGGINTADIVLEIDSDTEDTTSVLLENDIDEEEQAHEAEAYDNEILHRVIEDAGRWAFGVILTELWVLDDTGTQLFRPDCGWWIDHYADKDDTFSRLTDESLPDHIPADPLKPGVGLAGYLWSQSTRGGGRYDTVRQNRMSVARNSIFGGGRRESLISRGTMFSFDGASAQSGAIDRRFGSANKLTWCQVKPLADDPNQPFNERTRYLANAGLGLAAGVPFNTGGTRGIVVYMARESADIRELTDSTNEEHMRRATSVIASCYALRRSRIALLRKRKKDINACWRRMRLKLLAIRFMGFKLADVIRREEQKKIEQQPESISEAVSKAETPLDKVSVYFKAKMKQQATKFMGANIKAPPPFGWMASFFTFMGCFLTLAMITNVSNAMVESFGPDYSIVLPPFGALVGLHYGLTAAPASQPQNAMVGQTLGLVMAHLIGTSLEVDLWLRQSLATALAIGVMVKFGVVHPPAGAAAVVFSTGNMTWIQVGMMLFGNMLAILSSTLINNWNEKRQYPTSWGLQSMNCFTISRIFPFAKKNEGKGDGSTYDATSSSHPGGFHSISQYLSSLFAIPRNEGKDDLSTNNETSNLLTGRHEEKLQMQRL